MSGVPPDWSASGGPDLFTLRAWLGVEAAAGTVDGLDAAVGFMQDRLNAIFGRTALPRFTQFIDERGLGEDAAARLLADDELLAALLALLLIDEEASDPPDVEYEWRAFGPGDRGRRFRRAVRRRREAAALAFLLPDRRGDRVAGARRRDQPR